MLSLLTISLLLSISAGDNGEFMVCNKSKQLIAVALGRTLERSTSDDCG